MYINMMDMWVRGGGQGYEGFRALLIQIYPLPGPVSAFLSSSSLLGIHLISLLCYLCAFFPPFSPVFNHLLKLKVVSSLVPGPLIFIPVIPSWTDVIRFSIATKPT